MRNTSGEYALHGIDRRDDQSCAIMHSDLEPFKIPDGTIDKITGGHSDVVCGRRGRYHVAATRCVAHPLSDPTCHTAHRPGLRWHGYVTPVIRACNCVTCMYVLVFGCAALLSDEPL